METNKKPVRSEGGFDTVKMMREIREKLSEKYWKYPEVLKQEMEDFTPILMLVWY